MRRWFRAPARLVSRRSRHRGGRPCAAHVVTGYFLGEVRLLDGHTLLISTTEGFVSTWDTRRESWVDFACTVAGRKLTEDEWRDAFGSRPYHETCPAAAVRL